MADIRIPDVGESVNFYVHGEVGSKPIPALVVSKNDLGVIEVGVFHQNAHFIKTYTGVRHMSKVAELPLPVRVETGGWDHTPRNIALDATFAALSARLEQIELQLTEPKATKKREAVA